VKVDDPAGKDLAGKIAVTVDHLTSVVAEITAFSVPGASSHADGPASAARRMPRLARARRPTEGVEIITAYDSSCPTADRHPRAQEAFLNLILNALRRSRARRLTVATVLGGSRR
jgi:hypothetical protein